jgi:hypothetical protein
MSSSMGRIIPYNYIYVSLYIHIIWKIKHVWNHQPAIK